MMKNNEKTVSDLFLFHKQEIKDNGFSSKVMGKLPTNKSYDWVIYLFTLIGISIFVFSGTYQWILTDLLQLCESFLVGKLPTFSQVGSYLFFMGIFLYFIYEFLFSQKKDDFLF